MPQPFQSTPIIIAALLAASTLASRLPTTVTTVILRVRQPPPWLLSLLSDDGRRLPIPKDVEMRKMEIRRTTFKAVGIAVFLSPAWAFASQMPAVSGAGAGAGAADMKPAFTLYSSDKCPYAQRTWIAARELGVPFDFHAVELGKDNREDWFLKLNPLGKVPTLVCGDDVVYESLVVNEYLAEVFQPGGEHNAAPLMPNTPALRAKARVMAQRSNDLVTAYFTYLSNKDEEQEAGKRETFEKELRTLDDWAAAAAGGEPCGWLCGVKGEGSMTLADMAYFPFLERIDATLKPFKGWGLSELGVPALIAWMDKCRAQDSVAGTLKDPVIWTELYKKFLGANYFERAGMVKK